ncbi:uncharacterized [Tachysurus ichikawai]
MAAVKKAYCRSAFLALLYTGDFIWTCDSKIGSNYGRFTNQSLWGKCGTALGADVNESHAFFLLRCQRLLSLPELPVCFGRADTGGSAGTDGQKNSP